MKISYSLFVYTAAIFFCFAFNFSFFAITRCRQFVDTFNCFLPSFSRFSLLNTPEERNYETLQEHTIKLKKNVFTTFNVVGK